MEATHQGDVNELNKKILNSGMDDDGDDDGNNNSTSTPGVGVYVNGRKLNAGLGIEFSTDEVDVNRVVVP